MEALWLLVFFFLSGSVIYMIRAYRKSMRQNKLILLQSKEIQKQNRELEHRNKLLQELNVEKQQIIGIVSQIFGRQRHQMHECVYSVERTF